MQNKGAIKVFAIAFALVCLYQLSFTYFTKREEGKASKYAYSHSDEIRKQAKELAKGDELRENYLFDSIGGARTTAYLDSMSNETIYNFLWLRKFSYKDCKAREINMGLDLKGGMNVMMEVSTEDVVRALANHTNDSIFNKAVNLAKEKQRSTSKDFVTLFAESIKEIDPNVKLAGYFTTQLRDKIKLTDNNEKVIEVVKKESADAFDRTYQILRQRIDKFGVSQPNIQKLSASERILVELPGIKEPERVRKLLQGTAQLEFWLAAEFKDVYEYLDRANTYLASIHTTSLDTVANPKDSAVLSQELANDTNSQENEVLASLKKSKDSTSQDPASLSKEEQEAKDPLFSRISLNVDRKTGALGEGPVVGMALSKDRQLIDEMLSKAVEKRVIPAKYKFYWDAKPLKGSDVYQLYAIEVTTRDGSALLGGDVITDAHQDYGNDGGVEVSMTMNAEGAREWKKVTGANIGKCIAIVLDNYVYSAPRVNGEIPNGRSSITGTFSVEEGKDLANILKAGKLPAPARIVQEAVVGPSLGKESINAGFFSFLIAFILILAYMVFFYKNAGMISGIALVTNIFFLMGVLASLGAVLTLPGIAGIVLTLAMAVDANVIINERVKEELRAGKTLSTAVSDGYKHAYSAIIDGNVTTLLTGIVLIIFGTGPIQGFAVTLCVGILTSLFTSIFITRLTIDYLLARKKNISFYFPMTKNFLANTHIDFVGMRKKFYVITISLVLIAVGSLVFKGLNYGVDFTGGRTYVIRFDQDVRTDEIRKALEEQFDGIAPEVKTFGPNTQAKITTKYKINEDSDPVKKEIQTKLYKGCLKFYKKPLTQSEFESTLENPLGIISSEIVGPTIANDIKRSAVIAVALALLMIFIYIGLRFSKWQYGIGGLVSLANDALVTIGVFALFNGILPFTLEADQSFIAAILTIIGYSINDTVIVFDRVREYVKLYPRRDFKDVMNEAINSTLSRTVNTVGSTFLVLLMIFIFGGEVIRGFAFALLFGVGIGAYSSIFIACPVAYELITRQQKKKALLHEKK